jgi:hypothetical protein
MTVAPEKPLETPLLVDASPAEIRAGLIPEEQADFDRDWQEACDQAVATLNLAELRTTLESYRRHAILVRHLGADGYRQMLVDAEERLRSGEPAPGSVSLDRVKAMIAERLGR